MSQFSSPPPPPPGSLEYSGAYPAPFGRKASNGPAITSLVTGILGLSCLPGIGSLLAIPFGLAGIARARRPNTGGKAMAVSGLLLGVLGILVVGGISYAIYSFARSTTSVVHFMQAIDRGDAAAARANAASSVTDAEIQQLIAACRSLGKLQDVTRSNISYSNVNGAARYEVTGTASFANGMREFKIVLLKQGGAYKVASLTLKEPDVE
jgi:hypothetical protein